MFNKVSKLLYVLALAVVLVGVLFASVNWIKAAPVLEANAAPNASTAATLNVLTKVGVTTTVTSVVQDVRPYAYGDCYIYTTFAPTAGASQTLTMTFQHAAVAGYWINYGTVAAVTSSLAYSSNQIVGNYMRAIATVATTTYPVSYSVNCVLR